MNYLKNGISVQATLLTILTPENVAFDKHCTPNALHTIYTTADTVSHTGALLANSSGAKTIGAKMAANTDPHTPQQRF